MRAVVFVVLLASFALAQSFQGTLRGRVLDPKGATASAATVTVTDEGTSVRRQTITNEQGEYTFASLTPSTYTVTVESPGFKRVEVKADAPPLETGGASTGQSIDSQNLPLLGRNPFTTFTNSSFGVITSQINNPRLVQLGTRITF